MNLNIESILRTTDGRPKARKVVKFDVWRVVGILSRMKKAEPAAYEEIVSFYQLIKPSKLLRVNDSISPERVRWFWIADLLWMDETGAYHGYGYIHQIIKAATDESHQLASVEDVWTRIQSARRRPHRPIIHR